MTSSARDQDYNYKQNRQKLQMLSRALFVTAVFLGALTQAVDVQPVDASLTPDVYAETEVQAQDNQSDADAINETFKAQLAKDVVITKADVAKARASLKEKDAKNYAYWKAVAAIMDKTKLKLEIAVVKHRFDVWDQLFPGYKEENYTG